MTTILDLPLRPPAGAGVPQRPVIRADWHDDPLIMLGRSVPYLVTPASRDPHRSEGGTYPMPRAQLAELQRLAQSGTRFHRIAIAHEIDPGGPVKSLLPTLERGPVTCTDDVARLVVGPVPVHPGVARGVKTLDLLAGGVRGIGWTVRAGAERLLDPIVFGVVGLGGVPRDGEPADWYPLVMWRW